MAACLGPVHQRGDSGPPVRPSEQLGNRQGCAAKSRHPTRVSGSSVGTFAAGPMHKAWCLSGGPVTRLWPCFRVLLADANELIEMQTRNDSSDPRSSGGFYERYHNLEDVGVFDHIPASYTIPHRCSLKAQVILKDQFSLCNIQISPKIQTTSSSATSEVPSGSAVTSWQKAGHVALTFGPLSVSVGLDVSKLTVSTADLCVDEQDPTGLPHQSQTHSHRLLEWEAAALHSEGLFPDETIYFFVKSWKMIPRRKRADRFHAS